MERLFKVMVAGLVGLGLLVAAMWLFSRHTQESAASKMPTQPAAPAPASAYTKPEDACRAAVVLTLQPHSGVSASMSVQDLDGRDIPTQGASEDEARVTTPCYQAEGTEPPDGSPQTIKICKPTSFVLHISGSGKGVFDLQAKPFPDVDHPISPLLLCNYALDSDKVYDWVLKYKGRVRPAVFLLGSKGDPSLRP